ncbi:hypothetical protein [Hymenobacter sp. BT730]|uniref:hypothetical protein n=1 Tax=Hymenobacter sp. BT730 TaxID=3063332 RepID=UPI0026DF1E97|nr:hypothetical protein [Hymenobacter sp. BT730]
MAPELSRKHRAWIALYDLEAGLRSRTEILRLHDVTDEDLQLFEESWQWMRTRRSLTPVVSYN